MDNDKKDNENIRYVSSKTIKQTFEVSVNSLRRWSESGKIRYVHTSEGGLRKGNRLYCIQDVNKMFGINRSPLSKITALYARVSSSHQKEDLDRQIKFLNEKYPTARMFQDIGSGINWKRPGLLSLLEEIHKGNVGSVVVSYKDRLCRFGSELLEWFFEKNNVKLVVLNSSVDPKDPTKELADDLLAITTVFVARNNGLRAGRNNRFRKRKESKKHQDTAHETTTANA